VLVLAVLLRDVGFIDIADTLERAYDTDRWVIALTITAREAISVSLTIRPRDSPSSAACSCEREWTGA
jgi:hypothetical protein